MKTNDHNKRLYLDMQEEPDKYSDQEIETLIDELDQVPDVDEAWQQFAQQHLPLIRPARTWRKVAAMLIGILTMSGIAIAAIHIARQSYENEQPMAGQTGSMPSAPSPQSEETDTIAKAGTVVFDNVTLDSIARDIASYHHVSLEIQSEGTIKLRFYFVWNQEDNLLEIVEKLNMFEHVDMTVENGKLIVR